ncbi:MAG: hypothetical protein LBH93_06260 [Chitinispirillales bacterium]|nr:hypothetical protein [Chitinispirillales bacterium]
MNSRFPPEAFQEHLDKRRKAIANAEASKELLDGAVQRFPEVVDYKSVESSFDDLAGFGIVFTAGGEGERLRLSLIGKGVSEESLCDFTKATYPLKGFYEDFGALQINLAMVGWICREYGVDMPVIVTTGPKGSVTDRVIPKIISKYNNFGISNIKIIPQDERLHFTVDEKIAVRLAAGSILPVTHPDETGGPLMKLKRRIDMDGVDGPSIPLSARVSTQKTSAPAAPLQWLSAKGCEKLLIIQATALYDPRMLSGIAAAAKGRDCVGVGIPRKGFAPDDPFGTFVVVEKNGESALCIVEQGIRNGGTRAIADKNTGAHLPFNTGLYAVDCKLLESSELPDYATPPKEVLPGAPRSPKIGYAATDILPLARRPVVLTVAPNMYSVIKSARDLESIADAADRFGLRETIGAWR